MTVYGFANLGRARRVDQVEQSMATIRVHLEKVSDAAVLFLNEIDEGDRTKPSDHQLLREYFTGWRKSHMRRKDPILTRGIRSRRRRWFRAAGGVPHQSPARQINEQIEVTPKGEPDVAVITGHYPAGAYNGERPAHIRTQLKAGYDNMQAIHAARIQEHHRAGRHVVWGMDCNNRDFPRLHRAEVTYAHHGPDYLRFIPAPGWTVRRVRSGAAHLDIEALHELLWAEPAWKKEK